MTKLLSSFRLMWRKRGGGEMYAYLPKNMQVKSLCKTNDVVCNQDYGYSLGRDSFSWKTQKWNTVTQIINLNNVGKQDGFATVQYNGQTVFSVGSLVYRTSQYTVAGIGKNNQVHIYSFYCFIMASSNTLYRF